MRFPGFASVRHSWIAMAILTLSCARTGLPPALTTIRGVKELTRAAAHGDRNVELRGVVTMFDVRQGVLYLQDATGALALQAGDLGAPVVAGETVLLSGTIDAGAA